MKMGGAYIIRIPIGVFWHCGNGLDEPNLVSEFIRWWKVLASGSGAG